MGIAGNGLRTEVELKNTAMLPLLARPHAIHDTVKRQFWRLIGAVLAALVWLISPVTAELPYKPTPLLLELHPPFPGPYWGLAEGPDHSVVVGADGNVGIFDGLRWHHISLPGFSVARALLMKGKRLWIGGPKYIGWISPDSIDRSFHRVLADVGGESYALLDAGENVIALTTNAVILFSPDGRVVDRVEFSFPSLRHYFRWKNGWIIQTRQDAFFIAATNKLIVTSQTPISQYIISNEGILGAVPIGDAVFFGGALASYEYREGELTKITSPHWGDLSAEHLISVFKCGEPETLLRLSSEGGLKGFDLNTKDSKWHIRVGEEIVGVPMNYPVTASVGILFASKAQIYCMPSISEVRRLTGSRQEALGVDASAERFWVSSSDGSWSVNAVSWSPTEARPAATWSVASTSIGVVRGEMNMLDIDTRKVRIDGGAQVNEVASTKRGFITAQGTRLTRWTVDLKPSSIRVPALCTGIVNTDADDIIFGTVGHGVQKWSVDGTLESLKRRSDFRSVVKLYEGHLVVLWGDGLLEIGDQRVQLPGSPEAIWKSLAIGRDAIFVGGQNAGSASLLMVHKTTTDHWSVRVLDHKILNTLSDVSRMAICGDRVALAGPGGCIDVAISFFDHVPVLPPPRIVLVTAAASERGVGSSRRINDDVGGYELRPSEDEMRFVLKGGPEYWARRTKFYYRITPDSVEWAELDSGKEVVLQRIGAGAHTLEIESRWLGESRMSRFKIFRPPHWYASRWAYGAYLFGAVGVAFCAGVWRTRRLARHARVLEERVAQRTAELRKANEAKDEFLASMSHEIRNPLNGVIGLSAMLRESAPTERDRKLTESLRACADQLRLVLDDVLDFAVIGRGDVQLQVAPFDPVAAVRAAVLAVDPKWERTRLTFAPELAGVRLNGDEGKVRQIVSNLVSNAHKYGVPPSAEVNAMLGQDRFSVSVSNTGPDIPLEDRSRIFGSFERGRSQSHKHTRGAGLGLTICARFARAMGGEVAVKSEGGLTCFTFSAPLAVSPANANETEPNRAVHRGHALAIEDEAYNRLVLGHVLAGLGYDVDWAQQGDEALEILQSSRGYDIIFTDWMLSDMQGAELVRRIKALCRDGAPPIVAVTAYATAEKRAEALEAGVAAFVTKPITTEKIQAAVRSLKASGSSIAKDAREDEPLRLGVLLQGPNAQARITDYRTEVLRRLDNIREAVKAHDANRAAKDAHQLASQMLAIHHHTLADELRALESTAMRNEWEAAREHLTNAEHAAAAVDQLLADVVARLKNEAKD